MASDMRIYGLGIQPLKQRLKFGLGMGKFTLLQTGVGPCFCVRVDSGGARIINLGIPTTKTNKTGRKVQFIFKIIITVQ
jgi:hypothetical protein